MEVIAVVYEWQWHQLGHMQVCTLLQTDNHATTQFFTGRMSFLPPNQQRQSTEGMLDSEWVHCASVIDSLPGWAGTRKVKPIWILLKQETVSGSDWYSHCSRLHVCKLNYFTRWLLPVWEMGRMKRSFSEFPYILRQKVQFNRKRKISTVLDCNNEQEHRSV